MGGDKKESAPGLLNLTGVWGVVSGEVRRGFNPPAQSRDSRTAFLLCFVFVLLLFCFRFASVLLLFCFRFASVLLSYCFRFARAAENRAETKSLFVCETKRLFVLLFVLNILC